MTALLRDMEKAKSDNMKLQRLQMLANAQHHLNKQQHPDQAHQVSLLPGGNPYCNAIEWRDRVEW